MNDDNDRYDENDLWICPACGNPVDYCQGHGEIGDPYGHETLRLHEMDIHNVCHPNGCLAAHERATV